MRVHIVSILLSIDQFIWGESGGRMGLTSSHLLLQDVKHVLLNLRVKNESISSPFSTTPFSLPPSDSLNHPFLSPSFRLSLSLVTIHVALTYFLYSVSEVAAEHITNSIKLQASIERVHSF